MTTQQQNEQAVYAEVCLEVLNQHHNNSQLLEDVVEAAGRYNLDTRKLSELVCSRYFWQSKLAAQQVA